MTLIQISIILSIGSLALGLSAWILGILAIIRPKASVSYANTVCSFSLCAVSLLLQLFEVQNRVKIRDYAAIEDTIRAVIIAAVALVFVTFALNIVAFAKARKK